MYEIKGHFSPSDHIFDTMIRPVFLENINLKPFLSLLCFVHGYFSYGLRVCCKTCFSRVHKIKTRIK